MKRRQWWKGIVFLAFLAAIAVGITACEAPWDDDDDNTGTTTATAASVRGGGDDDEEDDGGGDGPSGSMNITISRGT